MSVNEDLCLVDFLLDQRDQKTVWSGPLLLGSHGSKPFVQGCSGLRCAALLPYPYTHESMFSGCGLTMRLDRWAAVVYPGYMNKKVDDAEFVAWWMECETIADVAKNTGLTANSVTSRAYQLRKKGVKLPYKPRKQTPTDVETLNSLIEQFVEAQLKVHIKPQTVLLAAKQLEEDAKAKKPGKVRRNKLDGMEFSQPDECEPPPSAG